MKTLRPPRIEIFSCMSVATQRRELNVKSKKRKGYAYSSSVTVSYEWAIGGKFSPHLFFAQDREIRNAMQWIQPFYGHCQLGS